MLGQRLAQSKTKLKKKKKKVKYKVQLIVLFGGKKIHQAKVSKFQVTTIQSLRGKDSWIKQQQKTKAEPQSYSYGSEILSKTNQNMPLPQT